MTPEGAGIPAGAVERGATLWTCFALAGLAAAFAVDLVTPLGLAVGTAYMLAVLAAAMSRRTRVVIATAMAAIALTGLGYFLSPTGFDPIYAALNRFVSILGLLAIAGLSILVLRKIRQRSEAEAMLAVASAIAGLGGWNADLRQGRVRWSPQVCALLGIARDSRPDLDQALAHYTEESRVEVSKALAECAADGKPLDLEARVRTVDGRTIPVRVAGRAVRDAAGRIVGVDGMIQDISEQKRLRSQIEEAGQRFRQLAEAMPVIVWTAESDGRIDYASNAYFDYAGKTPGRDREAALIDSLHPEDRQGCISAWRQAVADGRSFAFDARLRRHQDGSHLWHHLQAEPVRAANGAIVKWYGSAMEVHERKLRETALEDLSDGLERTLDSIADPIYTVDRTWRFTFVNDAAETLLGRRREELLGRVLWDMFPQAVGQRFHGEYHRAMRENQPVTVTDFARSLEKWIYARAYPHRDGLSVYLQDVTADRAVAEKLQRAQRLEAVGQLTGGIAHDFNNLLTVILGNAELLEEDLQDDPRHHALARTTRMAAERGAELTSRLLAFARRQALSPQPTDIAALVAGMDALLRRSLGEHIQVETVCAEKLRQAIVDPAQLENAILNLGLNARDAMPEGGRLTIEMTNLDIDDAQGEWRGEIEPGPYVRLAVSDTGTGMPPEVVASAFEPFFTTKDIGKGSGLGLSMVFGFAKQSNGHVTIASEPGRGTTVTLCLPAIGRPADTALATQPTPALPKAIGGERILLVEDDAMVRSHVEAQLLALGYQVATAADGPAALAILEGGGRFDLLFTDVVMSGGISGPRLAEAAGRLRPGLPILFTSGYTQNAIVHHGRLDPGVQLLQKPYRRQDLALKLREVLDARGSPDQGRGQEHGADSTGR